MSHSLFLPRTHACISNVDFLARARALMHFLARPQALFHSLILSFAPFLSIPLSFSPLISHNHAHAHAYTLSFVFFVSLARARTISCACALEQCIIWSLHRWRMHGVVNASNGGEDREILWWSFAVLLYYDVHIFACSYVSNPLIWVTWIIIYLSVCLFIDLHVSSVFRSASLSNDLSIFLVLCSNLTRLSLYSSVQRVDTPISLLIYLVFTCAIQQLEYVYLFPVSLYRFIYNLI